MKVLKIFTNERIILSVIVLNSIIIFLLGFEELVDSPFLHQIDIMFAVYFVLEMFFKIRESGWNVFWSSKWNRFDFIIVAISFSSILEWFLVIPDLSYLLVFRMVRLVRLFRFMKFVPKINMLIDGLKRAMKASIFVILGFFLYNFLLAILSSYLFRGEAPAYFGNPAISFYTIFRIFTVEGWELIPESIALTSGVQFAVFTRIYFVFVVLTGGIFGFSVVNAIFVDEMTADNNIALENKIDDLQTQLVELKELILQDKKDH